LRKFGKIPLAEKEEGRKRSKNVGFLRHAFDPTHGFFRNQVLV